MQDHELEQEKVLLLRQTPFHGGWPLAEAAQLACWLEATAPKLGNVHPGAAFSDMHFGHFATSAMAVRASFAALAELPAADWTVGRVVLESVTATQRLVDCNTNLGTLLLFAPLAVAWLRLEAGSTKELEITRQVLAKSFSH
ncbi:MAG: triphosphoribosyl-dephospho-CoA synthase [Pirellulaceae bacterium]